MPTKLPIKQLGQKKATHLKANGLEDKEKKKELFSEFSIEALCSHCSFDIIQSTDFSVQIQRISFKIVLI